MILPFILASALIFCWPALYNGYPLVYSDTGTYLMQAIALEGAGDRPPYYSLFLFPFHLKHTLWFIPLIQAILVAWVLLRFVESVWRDAPRGRYLLAAVLLGTLSSLSWSTSQIMPDFFAPLCALLVVTLAWHEHLHPLERLALTLLLLGSLAVHYTHCALALAVLAVVLAASPRREGRLRVSLEMLACSFAAILSFIAYNYALTRHIGVSPMTPVFMLSRSLEDGPARAYLNDTCPNPRYFLCTVRERIPKTSNEFIWGGASPLQDFYKAKGEEGVSQEASEIVSGAFHSYPSWQARAAALNWIRQLGRFQTGDFISPYLTTDMKVTKTIRARFPSEFPQFVTSRQVQNRLPLALINRVHNAVIGISFFAALVFFFGNGVERSRARVFFLVVLTLILVNSMMTGVLAEPIDRYGNRVIWLVPLAAIMLTGATPGSAAAGDRPRTTK